MWNVEKYKNCADAPVSVLFYIFFLNGADRLSRAIHSFWLRIYGTFLPAACQMINWKWDTLCETKCEISCGALKMRKSAAVLLFAVLKFTSLTLSLSLSLSLWNAAVWKSGAALVFSSARNITRAGEEEKLKFSPYAPHHLKTGARVF
jgi:hypothetical protein